MRFDLLRNPWWWLLCFIAAIPAWWLINAGHIKEGIIMQVTLGVAIGLLWRLLID